MDKRFTLSLFIVLLVALVTGCGGMHHYDGRLTAADSLMMPYPDSALALVTAIPDSALTTEGDRAYRDLLMTQARYKCYAEITASDDSAICRAMDYYRRHDGERDKLTRAYLYKGAVMEELGHVDSAMYYYKTAEAAADEKDYANLGQINTRIGTLYQWYYVNPQICYDKFKKALEYYRLTGNKRLQIDCLFYMAGCSGITHIDDPEQLLSTASQLASEISDSLNFFRCNELLCRQLAFKGDSLSRAKQIAMLCLNDYRDYVNHDLILDLADIYVKSGMPDSARFYLDMVTESAEMANLEQVKTRKYLIMSDISKLEGDTALSSHYDMLSHQVSDSISNSKVKYQIQQIENDNNIEQKKFHVKTIHDLRWLLRGIIVLAFLALIVFAFYHQRRVHRIKAIIEELKRSSVNKHESLVEQVPQNSEITVFIENLVTFMQTLIDSSQHESPSVIRKRIEEGIGSMTANEDFWNALKTHLDQNHDGLITRLAQTPRISDNDVKFIELCCCGFNYLEIAIILGYAPKYISQKRKDVARKLHLRMPLQEYLNDAMKHTSSPK